MDQTSEYQIVNLPFFVSINNCSRSILRYCVRTSCQKNRFHNLSVPSNLFLGNFELKLTFLHLHFILRNKTKSKYLPPSFTVYFKYILVFNNPISALSMHQRRDGMELSRYTALYVGKNFE